MQWQLSYVENQHTDFSLHIRFWYCRSFEPRRLRQACADAQTRQSLRRSRTQSMDIVKTPSNVWISSIAGYTQEGGFALIPFCAFAIVPICAFAIVPICAFAIVPICAPIEGAKGCHRLVCDL